jgi:hypothetical protein
LRAMYVLILIVIQRSHVLLRCAVASYDLCNEER